MKATVNKAIAGSVGMLVIVEVFNFFTENSQNQWIIDIREKLPQLETFFAILVLTLLFARMLVPICERIIPTLENGFNKIAETIGTQFQQEAAKTREEVFRKWKSEAEFRPIPEKKEKQGIEQQLSAKLEQIVEFYEKGKSREALKDLVEFESLVEKNIENITDISFFGKVIDFELLLQDEEKRKKDPCLKKTGG